MKEYFLTLMAVAVLNAVMGMLSPDGDLKKYVGLLGTLCLLLAMAQPLLGWQGEGQGFLADLWDPEMGEETPDYGEIYGQALTSGGKQNLETLLREQIAQEFSIPEDSLAVSVGLVIEDGEGQVSQVRLTLRDSAVFADPRALTEYINQRLDCPCIVLYD